MKLLHSDDLHHHLGSNCCSEKSKTSTLGLKTPEIKRDVKHDIRKVNLLDKHKSDTRIDTHINPRPYGGSGNHWTATSLLLGLISMAFPVDMDVRMR